MIYLNIVLTLILLVFLGNLWANLTYGKRQEEEHNKMREYNKRVNDEVLELHREMLEELKRIV